MSKIPPKGTLAGDMARFRFACNALWLALLSTVTRGNVKEALEREAEEAIRKAELP